MINAFAILITQVFGLQDIMAAEQSWLWCFKSMGGQMLGTIMIPVLSAYMAYSLGDKTALAPGFAAGIAANIIGGGFLCGMLGGIIAGYTVRFLRKTIPAKGTLAGFVSFWVYPVLSTIIVGIGIFLILGKPVAWINTVLIDFLGSMSGSNGAILGAILGIMFGIKRCMFWRGTSERMGSDKTEFFWEGDDNSKVTVQLLPLGYAIGKYLPADHEALKQRMDKYLPVLDRGATTEHILLPNGHDQMPVQKNIFDVMKSIEECYPGRVTKISRYEEIFDIIEKNKNLDTLKGEFLDGKYMRVHRSIYSSRADLKSSNTRIENKITNILEPLASIAYSLGFDYHHGLIEAIWKELMKNHAHDSIGCCCSDKVHRAIADRFFLAEDRTDCLIEFYKRKITDAMSCDITLDKLVVFNTLPYARNEVVTGEIITKMKGFVLEDEKGNRPDFEILSSEIVDAGLIDRQIVHYGDYDPFVKYTVDFMDEIPSMGFKTYFVKKTETEFTALEKNTLVEKQENVLENSFYKITVEDNGTLTVFDKNSEKSYSNVLMLEDGSDDGDGYDFSPLENDFVLTSENSKAQRTVSKSENISKAVITVDMDVPKNLESRKAKLADGKISVEFTVMCDVNNPLLGERGATFTFGAQKGGTQEILERLEKGMKNYAGVVEAALGKSNREISGAGAAGGLGFALVTFLNAKLKPGIDVVLDLINFDEKLSSASLVITGEGRMDWQSSFGKVPSGIGERCRKAGVPAVAIVGGLFQGYESIYKTGIETVVTTVNGIMTIDEAIDRCEELYEDAAYRLLKSLKCGMEISSVY